VAATWTVLAAALLGLAFADAPKLGLYYDEAFMAQQARDFVDGARESPHPGSVRSVEIFGRPFPTHNAAYLGSLKSQLTIPAFALFGSSPRVLRVTTCALALLALGLAMGFVAALFGGGAAIGMGLLAATDPAFFFLSQYEWGPFTTNLLCRAAGAGALRAAWRAVGPIQVAWAGAAGIAFGLGIYSRADFALVLAGAGVALLVFGQDVVRTSLRERRGAVLAGSAGLLLASAPMWTRLGALRSTGEAIASRGDLGERVTLLVQTLDGSRFHRLMEVGGVFERAGAVEVAPTALVGAVLGSVAVLVIEMARRRADPAARSDVALRGWLLSAALLVTAFTVALPGAVRAHHQLNVFPLWHAIVGVAVADLFTRPFPDPRRAVLARGVVSVAIGFVVAGQLASVAQTRALIDATGGRGRWSAALGDVAREVEEDGGEVVSLDWGFHEPLLFQTREAKLREAIWEIPQALRGGRAWGHTGDARTRYLVHDADYDLFGLGPLMLDLAAREGLEVDPRLDGEGATAFHVVRVHRPHVLVFDGRFRLR
jgi:hypothetical protein